MLGESARIGGDASSETFCLLTCCYESAARCGLPAPALQSSIIHLGGESLLRKPFLAAGTAALALGVAGIAYAQTPAPSIKATASVSPTKAGTKSKPKSEKLKLSVTNNRDSKTTAAKITITLPSTLKVSTSGLDICKASDDDLIASRHVCKKSVAGSGAAHALVNPFAATPAEVEFKVVPVVGKKEILFAAPAPPRPSCTARSPARS